MIAFSRKGLRAFILALFVVFVCELMFINSCIAQLNYNAGRVSLDTIRARSSDQGGQTGIMHLPYHFDGLFPTIAVNDTLLHIWVKNQAGGTGAIIGGEAINITAGNNVNLGGNFGTNISLTTTANNIYQIRDGTYSQKLDFNLNRYSGVFDEYNWATLGAGNIDFNSSLFQVTTSQDILDLSNGKTYTRGGVVREDINGTESVYRSANNEDRIRLTTGVTLALSGIGKLAYSITPDYLEFGAWNVALDSVEMSYRHNANLNNNINDGAIVHKNDGVFYVKKYISATNTSLGNIRAAEPVNPSDLVTKNYVDTPNYFVAVSTSDPPTNAEINATIGNAPTFSNGYMATLFSLNLLEFYICAVGAGTWRVIKIPDAI